METINFKIENGNVNIESNCTPDTFMKAVSVAVSSMAQNSTNTLEEILNIIEEHAKFILEEESLKTEKIEGNENDV